MSDKKPPSDDEDEFADIPEGAELKPTKLTPEVRRAIEDAEERMKARRKGSE